jgi:signal transduction histidine kinase
LENVEVLEKMVNHLVELKGTVLCYFENTDINELVLAALKQFDNKLAEQNIIQRTNLLSNMILIPVDRNNIRKAFANIIENSIDAMIGAKRNLTITTSVKEEFVEIEFTDTGKGIPENLFKNIYDPFYSSKTYGPGLGLTFALKTIQSHGGMISLSSKINEGSTFTVKLPVNRLSK